MKDVSWRRASPIRQTDPASWSWAIDDAALMQKRRGLGMLPSRQRSGQAVERVALSVDHHHRPGIVRQLRRKPDRFQKLPHDRRTEGKGFRRGARSAYWRWRGRPPRPAAWTTEYPASSSSSVLSLTLFPA